MSLAVAREQQWSHQGLGCDQKPQQFVSVRERGTLSSCPSDGDSAEAADKGESNQASQGSCSLGCSKVSMTAAALCSS